MQLLSLCLAVGLPLGLFVRSLWLARRLLKQRASRTEGLMWLAVYVFGALFAGTWLAATLSSLLSVNVEGRLDASLHQGPYLFAATLLVLEARRPLALLWRCLEAATRHCLQGLRRLLRFRPFKANSR